MRELQAKNLIKLRKQAFEEFCRKVLDEEYEGCFEPDAVEIHGPSAEDVPDGGRDLEATVHRPPARRGHWSLLPRQPGRIWFSCKSVKDGDESTWKDRVRDDIDPSPRMLDARKGKGSIIANPAQRARQEPKPPSELLEMLAAGGSYWILLNAEGDHVSELEMQFTRRLELWIEHGLGRKVDLTGRVKIKDATFLAKVFNERKFVLSGELSPLLEVDEADFLDSWEQWSTELPDDRRKVRFLVDAERKEVIDALDLMLGDASEADSEPRFLRIAGAPGVGKTRLVHHVLEDSKHESLHPRIRYTKQAETAREWLDRTKLKDSPDLVLVVDEVSAGEAYELWRRFERRDPVARRARLVLIGPRDDGNVGKPEPFLLEPFQSKDDRRTLVAHDLEDADEEDVVVGALDAVLIDLVADLAEGYPLFSMWLSRALAKDPTLLHDPRSALTDGKDPWRATAAVLAGPRPEHGGEGPWLAEAELRARALLRVVLVPDDPWSVPADQRASLVDALEVASWAELKRAAMDCKDRGLLRDEPADHYYISPANLERLVLDHLFGTSRGPDPGALREATPEGFERLLQRAARVRASEACRRRLASAALASLDDAQGELDPRSLRRLELIAQVDPEQTASTLVRLVERVGAQRIAEGDGLVRPIREALEHVRHRRISAEAFEAAEQALFMLALEKQEPWGNNARTGWASLFQAVLDQTHQSFESRLAILQRRLASPEPKRRMVALEGLVGLIVGDAGGFHPGVDDVDGPWSVPTEQEIGDRQRQGWRLLLQTTDDPDAEVSHRARAIVAEHLWSGLSRSSLGDGLDELPDRVGRWTPVERNALRAAVENALGRPMHGDEEQRAAMFERLAALRAALRPTDLQERLLSQVGRGAPAQLSVASAARSRQEREDDRALAREILEHPDVLTANLAWLTSEQAGRARVFAHALGLEDEAQVLLPLLLSARDQHPVDLLIVSYLSGCSGGAASTAVDRWLLAHASDPSLTNVVARTIVALGGTDDRARILMTLASRPELVEPSLLGLGFWSWHEGVSLPGLDALIAALARAPSRFCHNQGLGLVARRLERTPGEVEPPMLELAHSLLDSTSFEEQSAVLERDWIAVATGLHTRGDPSAMATVLTIVVHQGGYLGHARAVLGRWLIDDPVALWRVLAGELLELERPQASVLASFAADLDVVGRVPAGEILDWVGDDASRALKVAQSWSPHADDLDPVIRGLLARFGADSELGWALLAAVRVQRTGASFHRFEAEQLERATRWADDPQPEVSAWAIRVRDHLLARDEQRRARGYG